VLLTCEAAKTVGLEDLLAVEAGQVTRVMDRRRLLSGITLSLLAAPLAAEA